MREIPADRPCRGHEEMNAPARAATGWPDSYYVASANPAPDRPAVTGEIAPDICVVGGGYTGLSAALELAEKGHSVVLLEGAGIGWGASGRNGGQIVNGLNASLETITARYGKTTADFVGTLVKEGNDLIRARVAKHGIDCDLKDGAIFAAFKPAQMKALEAKRKLWREHGYDHFEMLDAAGIRTHVASELYCGGMLDRSGGHMHPLNLALGQAAAFEANGGVIHERSEVVSIDDASGAAVLRTAAAVIRPKTLILAGNAYLGHVVPELENRIMPFSTQMIATEPLGDRAREILPTDMCVEDVRYVLDYYRLSADGRLLFGGGTVYGGTDPADIRAKILPALARCFPHLGSVKVDHAWSGNCAISFSRVPQMGRLGANTYFACGYSGHGVVGSHLFGRILAEAVNGDLSRFDVFEKVPWIPFPGGRRFRVPYSMAGSWWYGLRDRLGV
jgi:gamma-glutamylputrescine oxidase